MTETPNPPTISTAQSLRYFLRGQVLQAGSAIVLTIVASGLATPALGNDIWLGTTDWGWFWAGISLAVCHQAYVWIVWRGQLGWGLFTQVFGRFDLRVHANLFVLFLFARPAVVMALGIADQDSLALPRWIELAVGVGLLLPAGYTLYSIGRYFGLERAIGGDHFRQSIRDRPLVHEGAFSWTPNAMYTFGPLALWSVGFLLGSHASLVAGLFQHAFLWAHHIGTERPDMEIMYGPER